jgi:hypothetical protein
MSFEIGGGPERRREGAAGRERSGARTMGELRSLRGVISSHSLVRGRLVLYTAMIITALPTGCSVNALTRRPLLKH